MNLRAVGVFLVSATLVLGCGNKKSDKSEPDKTVAEPQQKVAAQTAPKEPAKKKELKLNGEEWIPQEFELGQKKFKDPGVYVDGKPVGFLKFGDLPVPLKVSWHEEEASVPFKKGDTGPRTKIVKQRRYSFHDYFKALGIPLKKIKEVHLYGGAKRAIAVIVSGKKFRQSPDFMFRFGSDVFGKPIPACPPNLADGNCPDNIRTVVVYIDKKPPVRRGARFYFGEEKVEGIPYFGRPLRGGVRVYLDHKFAVHLKRNKLAENSESFKVELPDKSVRYKFNGFLEAQGVDTSKIVEAWLIHRDRRVHKFTAEELKDVMFAAADRGSGQILVGPDRIQTHAIALHTKPVDPKDIPVPQEWEIHDDRKR